MDRASFKLFLRWQDYTAIPEDKKGLPGETGILALTTARKGAQNLRNCFEIVWKTANAETAVKVAGATAKHCIVTHGVYFLSGEGRNLDYDQECSQMWHAPPTLPSLPAL